MHCVIFLTDCVIFLTDCVIFFIAVVSLVGSRWGLCGRRVQHRESAYTASRAGPEPVSGRLAHVLGAQRQAGRARARAHGAREGSPARHLRGARAPRDAARTPLARVRPPQRRALRPQREERSRRVPPGRRGPLLGDAEPREGVECTHS